jgi:hypothetical protein
MLRRSRCDSLSRRSQPASSISSNCRSSPPTKRHRHAFFATTRRSSDASANLVGTSRFSVPNLYFQGLLAFQPMIATEGHFVAPIGDARVSAVDVRDIAAVATRALTESGHEGKTYTITGPAAVTHTEMAGAIAEAIGRPVAFIDVPSDAFAGALKAAGVPAWQVDGLVEDYAHYARGEAETISPHVREVTGADPRDMGQFAKDYARVFVGA